MSQNQNIAVHFLSTQYDKGDGSSGGSGGGRAMAWPTKILLGPWYHLSLVSSNISANEFHSVVIESVHLFKLCEQSPLRPYQSQNVSTVTGVVAISVVYSKKIERPQKVQVW